MSLRQDFKHAGRFAELVARHLLIFMWQTHINRAAGKIHPVPA